jgi:SAM-dependent methyltransferase
MSSQTEKDIIVITDMVDLEDKSVLELGCGAGRITFELADKVREIVAIDIDAKAIAEARQNNAYEHVTFIVENMENFDLKRRFDLILSVGVGYMYLKDLPSAIRNISHHLDTKGVALLICSIPNNEYQRIVDLLVEENVRTVSFYNKFERILSNHFTFSKKRLKEQLSFSGFDEALRCFQRELKEEYAIDMNDHHEDALREYFQRKGKFTVEDDSQAYICKPI